MKKLGEITLNEIKDMCDEHISSGGQCSECPFWIFCMPETGMTYVPPTCWGTELEKEMEV